MRTCRLKFDHAKTNSVKSVWVYSYIKKNLVKVSLIPKKQVWKIIFCTIMGGIMVLAIYELQIQDRAGNYSQNLA